MADSNSKTIQADETEETKLRFVTSLRPEINKSFAADIYQGTTKKGEPYFCYRISRTFSPKDADWVEYMDWYFGDSAESVHAAAKLADNWIRETNSSPGINLMPEVLDLLSVTMTRPERARIPLDDLAALEKIQEQPETLSILIEFSKRGQPVKWKEIRASLPT